MKYRTKILTQYGFTLIELLITLAVSGILMAGVYTAFKSQQDSYLAQEQVAEMQQNIRAGLDVMVRDMRMAGFDPETTGTFGIVTATADEFRFTAADFDEDGNNEDISYDLYPPTYSDNDALGRSQNGGARNAIAENIEELEFFYVLADGTTSLDPVGDGLLVDDIRSVQISILARAGQPDRNYTNNQFYCPASHSVFNAGTVLCENPDDSTDTMAPWGLNDNIRRRFQIMTVQLRNMGF